MTFKTDWEKTSAIHQLSDEVIEEMLALSHPEFISGSRFRIKSGMTPDIKLLPGGCANLNYLVGLDQKYILRVYLRDPEAAYREQKLGELLKDEVPLPQTLFIGEHEGYTFALTTYLEGIPLAELLLSDEPHDVKQLMQAVGEMLAKINAHTFEHSGFLNRDLKPKSPLTITDYLNHARECLKNKNVESFLGSTIISKVSNHINRSIDCLPNQNQACLTHGDFDPANILVNRKKNEWRISGILDWEYSYSGSSLSDISDMLRYAHNMPKSFEEGFLAGLSIQKASKEWRLCINLLNLINLLDCLTRATIVAHPIKGNDIKKLIERLL